MNSFRKHVPDAFDGTADRVIQPFETLTELLAIPCVARWQAQPGFQRFSVATDAAPLLVAHLKTDCPSHWVVGFLERPIEGLPVFEASRE